MCACVCVCDGLEGGKLATEYRVASTKGPSPCGDPGDTRLSGPRGESPAACCATGYTIKPLPYSCALRNSTRRPFGSTYSSVLGCQCRGGYCTRTSKRNAQIDAGGRVPGSYVTLFLLSLIDGSSTLGARWLRADPLLHKAMCMGTDEREHAGRRRG